MPTMKQVDDIQRTHLAIRAELLRRSIVPEFDEPTPASNLVHLDQEWLFPGWVPAGKLTLLIGPLGIGKSLLATDIAARVSSGSPMPLTHWSPKASNVLLFALQDSISDTVVPRLTAANAESACVHLFRGGGLEQCTDPRLLELVINKYEASLVVIDPVPMDICRKQPDPRFNADTLMGSMSRVAEFTGAAILMVHAVPDPAEFSPRLSLSRSLRIATAARSVLHISRESDSENRILTAVKGNLAPRPQGLRFRIKSDAANSHPAVDWLEVVDNTEDRTDSTPSANAALKQAQEFLRGALSNGAVESRLLREMAREHGISLRTLERARKGFTRAVRINGLGPDGKWMVELSGNTNQPES